jgi:hypothetical protein
VNAAERRARRLAGDLVSELCRVHTRARDFEAGQGLAADLAKALVCAQALAAGRRHTDTLHRALDCGRAEFLASKIGFARLLACDLPEPCGAELAPGLSRAYAHARALVGIHQATVDASSFGDVARAGWIAPWAGWLVTAAARLMPAAGRDRYRAEYRSELFDIAVTGASRRAQARYALRQLVRALQVRAAVAARRPHAASGLAPQTPGASGTQAPATPGRPGARNAPRTPPG